MRPRQTIGLVGVLGLATLAYLLGSGRHAPPANGPTARTAASAAFDRRYDRGADSDEGTAARAVSPRLAQDSPGPALPPLDRRRADAVRAKILTLIAEAGPARTAVAAPPPSSSAGFPMMPPGGPGNQAKSPQGEYIHSVVRQDFFPLAQQCYGDARGRHPGLRGEVELHFRIVGDRSVGGVVDEASLADGGTLEDPEFAECMTQSMMSVTFDAPPGDQDITVTYPIAFSPSEDDAG